MFKVKAILQEVDYFDLGSGGGNSFDENEKKERKKEKNRSEHRTSDSHEPIDTSAVTTMLFTTIL